MTTKDAVSHICKEIVNDDGYWIAWQANIAMAFKDEYARVYGYQEGDTVHGVANAAAVNFLNTLIKNSEN